MKLLPDNSTVGKYDLAYACFLTIGILLSPIIFIELKLIDTDFFIGWVMLFGILMIIIIPLAGALGVILSIKLRHEWQLSLLSFLTIGIVVIEAAREFYSQIKFTADLFTVFYILFTLVLPLIWFLSRRKKILDNGRSPG